MTDIRSEQARIALGLEMWEKAALAYISNRPDYRPSAEELAEKTVRFADLILAAWDERARAMQKRVAGAT